MTQMAGCCQPLPGDAIVGYITQGRGVSIHRQDCASVLQLAGREPERIIQVSWGPVPVLTYPVDIVIRAYDRSGLLRDVSQVLLNERINVLAVNTRSNKEDNTALMSLTIEIPGLDALGRLLGRISQLPNIIETRRNVRPYPHAPPKDLLNDLHPRRPAAPHGPPARPAVRLPVGHQANLRHHRPAHPRRSLRSRRRHRAR
jgi:hypothetical protein